MAVEDVHTPKKKIDIDPKATSEKVPEDIQAVENEVKKARARRELMQETRLTEQIMNPPMEEPNFKVQGGINLGTIDFQEQQREMREEQKRMQEQSEGRIAQLTKERDDANKALQIAQMDHLREGLEKQIDSLRGAITAGSRRDIASELDAIESVAAKLGLSRQQQPITRDDFQSQIALKKLEQEIKNTDRRFALEMKKDERMWQLELKKLDQQQKESEARLAAEQNKYSMLASLPEQFGAAMAKGFIARGDNINSVSAKPPMNTPAPAKSNKPFILETGYGESGEISCPNCSTAVGIGPTTERTACAGCGSPFVVRRTQIATEGVEQ